MRNIVNSKTALRLLILMFLCLTLWAVYTRPVRTQQEERLIPIRIARQLEPEDGIIPVEIQCGTSHLTSPNTLERINCTLKNNSATSATAASVTYSIILQTSGGDSNQIFNRTLDALVHPDLKPSNKLVGSGEQTDIGTPGPTSYPDGIIGGVSIAMDYVEFEDGTRLGPDREGSRLIGET